jgi:hypothetical protein
MPPVQIEIRNNCHIEIYDNTILLESIEIFFGTINLYNRYIYKSGESTNVIAGSNAKVSIDGNADTYVRKVTLESGSSISIVYKNHKYVYSHEVSDDGLPTCQIQNMYKLMSVYEFIQDTIKNNKKLIDCSSYLKDFVKFPDENILKQFAEQNKMISPETINRITKDYFFEITGIAHNLDGSNLGVLPTELIGKICDELNFHDFCD